MAEKMAFTYNPSHPHLGLRERLLAGRDGTVTVEHADGEPSPRPAQRRDVEVCLRFLLSEAKLYIQAAQEVELILKKF